MIDEALSSTFLQVFWSVLLDKRVAHPEVFEEKLKAGISFASFFIIFWEYYIIIIPNQKLINRN